MPQLQIDLLAKDGASANIKGMTGSILSANIALEAMKKVASLVAETIKKGIEAYKEQDLAVAQLKQTVGGGATELINFANEIQKVTTIGDESTIGIMNYGLQLGITQEKIKQASKDAIGLSQAFGVDLNQSMKLVAMANQGQYTMLARYIPELRNATTEAEKQAIIHEKLANGYELAKGKAETFTGKLMQLDNAQSDVYENIGNIVSIIGKDYVQSMIDGANAVNEFLTNSENIASIGAGMATVGNIIKDLTKNGLEKGKEIVKEFTKSWKDMEKNTKVDTFDMLGVAVQTLSAAMNVSTQFVIMNIHFWVNLILTLIEAGRSIGAVFDLITGKAKWEDVQKQFSKTGETIGKLASDLVADTKSVITTAVNELKDFGAKSKTQADVLRANYKDTYDKIKSDLDKPIKAGEITLNTDEVDKKLVKTKMSFRQASEYVYETWKDNFDKMSKVEQFGEIAKKVQEFGGMIASIISDALSIAKEAWSQYYEDQLSMNSEWQDERLSAVDDWVSQEEEKRGVKEATDQERLQSEINALQAKLNRETDINSKTDLQQQINEKKDELVRQQIQDEAAKKKLKIQEDAKKKETALKKKQFEENKGWAIAEVWINAATSIMGWWASFASMGIPGIVLAAVMSAATLVMAGVQCLGKNVLIKLFNGTYKKAKDILITDILCGDDDKPRKIYKLYTGVSKMYKVKYEKKEFECTFNHPLSFYNNGKIINIEVEKYLKNRNKNYKLYRKIKNQIKIIDNFEIEFIGNNLFFGFEIDDNHLFKIENDLITHNTGLIASQTFHAAEGGVINAGTTSGDNTLLFGNKGEAVFQDETYKNLVKQINGGTINGGKNIFQIDKLYVMANSPEELADQLNELALQEANR